MEVPAGAPRGADERETLLLSPEDLFRKTEVHVSPTRRVVVCRATGRAADPRDLLGAACVPCDECADAVDISACRVCRGSGQRLRADRFAFATDTTRHSLPVNREATRAGTRWVLEGQATMEPGRVPGDVVCVAQVVASDAAGLGFLTVGTKCDAPNDLVVASRPSSRRRRPPPASGCPSRTQTARGACPHPALAGAADCGLRGTPVSRGAAPGGGLPPDGDLVVYLQCPGPVRRGRRRRVLARPACRRRAERAGDDGADGDGADGRALWLGVGPPVGRVSPGRAAPLGPGGQPSSDDDEDDPLLPRPVRATRRGTCAQQ